MVAKRPEGEGRSSRSDSHHHAAWGRRSERSTQRNRSLSNHHVAWGPRSERFRPRSRSLSSHHVSWGREFERDFAGTLPGAPSTDQLIPLHDAKTDFVPDPEAVVGFGGFYVLAHRALEDDPEGVESFDLDLVLGMSRNARIFYTSVDLETTEGWEHVPETVDDRPLAAGYHLFVGSLEVHSESFIEVELGYVAD